MPVNRAVIAILFLLTILAPGLSGGAGDADDFYEMKVGGDKALSILESLPWASEGSGPVMYFFEYSECPYCQAMYRDFSGKDVGIEFRRLFVPVSKRTAAETAALAKSRDIADYHAYMEGRKRAPNLDQDREAVDGHNAIILAGTRDLPSILKQNGWPLDGFAFPQYFWVENGRVFANAGYSKPSLEKAILRAKRGAVKKVTSAKAVPVSNSPKPLSGVAKADIGGIRLGMTPAEVEKVLSTSNKEYQVGTKRLSIHDRDFVATISGGLPLTNQAIMKRLGGGASDSIQVHFAPPPHENVAILISRVRTFGVNEQAPPRKVEKVIIDKYGRPDHTPTGGNVAKVDTLRRYLWRSRESRCDRIANSHQVKIRDYIFKDGNWGTLLNEASCPEWLYVSLMEGTNPRTRKRDFVYKLNSVLIDFPTIAEANSQLSELTRQINGRESQERDRKTAPTDI